MIGTAFAVTGAGPPVYLVHGIGSRKTAWEALTAYLADRFTCVAYDLRGHGDSEILPTPYSLADLVSDLEDLRSELGHEQIHIIGHSLGGMIGPAYARAHPDRTLSVGLLSTVAGQTAEDTERIQAVVTRLEYEGLANVLPTLVARWYTDEFVAARPDAIEKRLAEVLETPEHVFMSVLNIYAETDMAPWLSEVTAPCLIVTGEHDPGCPPRLNRLIDNLLPDSELVILDGLRHSILVEAPDQVGPIVRDFLLAQAAA